MNILTGFLSILGVLAIAWLLSNKKKSVRWRTIGIGLLIEGIFVLFVLKVNAGKMLLEKASAAVQNVINYSNEGIQFVFGGLYEQTDLTFVFAINVLAVIIFISALVSALYYLRVIPLIVQVIGVTIGKLMGTTKVETFNAVGNSFLGLAEAPLLVKPYLKLLTRSEIFAIMVGGTASASGAI
ncbi:MAG: Na+ dependent nucleoside transporter N-terminal domain-containing protein, partial [Anaerobacillus sp.]